MKRDSRCSASYGYFNLHVKVTIKITSHVRGKILKIASLSFEPCSKPFQSSFHLTSCTKWKHELFLCPAARALKIGQVFPPCAPFSHFHNKHSYKRIALFSIRWRGKSVTFSLTVKSKISRGTNGWESMRAQVVNSRREKRNKYFLMNLRHLRPKHEAWFHFLHATLPAGWCGKSSSSFSG